MEARDRGESGTLKRGRLSVLDVSKALTRPIVCTVRQLYAESQSDAKALGVEYLKHDP